MSGSQRKPPTWRDVRAANRDGFFGAMAFAVFHLRCAGEDTYAAELVQATGRSALARWCQREGDKELARYIRTVT